MSQSRVGSLLASLSAAIVALAPAFAQGVVSAPPVSDDIASVPPAVPLDAHRLRSLFLDLLGRPPFDAERERWLGEDAAVLSAELVGSPEYWRHWFDEQLYYFLLIDNFEPKAERVLAIPDDLARGTLDVREAVHRIALSSSFDQRNPGADTFVTVVMEQLDGIEVQKSARELQIGKAIYDGTSGVFLGDSGANQADIVRIAIEHKLFAQTFIAREYQRILGAPPDKTELAAWAREFHREPRGFPALVRQWLASPRYDERLARARPVPNRLFVRALFVDLRGRLPANDEENRTRNALDGLADPVPLRSVIARLMLDSEDVSVPARDAIRDTPKWIREQFERLLGRAPSENELRVFVSALQDPALRPSTVIYALVSHPEYQSY